MSDDGPIFPTFPDAIVKSAIKWLAGNKNANTIVCLVCGKQGEPKDVHATGWRLAPNRVGGYTCSIPCDDVIVAYDEAKKAEAKALKKKPKPT